MPSLVSRGLHCLSYFRRFPDGLEVPVVYLADYIAQTFRYAGHIDADSGAGRAQKIEAHESAHYVISKRTISFRKNATVRITIDKASATLMVVP